MPRLLTPVLVCLAAALTAFPSPGQSPSPPADQYVPPPPFPPPLSHLRQASVREELRVTELQGRRIARLESRYWQAIRDVDTLGTAERRKSAVEIAQIVETGLGEILEPEQARRLRQITLQMKQRAEGSAAIFSIPEVLHALKLSQQQQEKREALLREHAKARLKVFLSGEKYEQVVERTQACKSALYEQMVTLLDRDQKARLTELLGQPFNGEITSDPLRLRQDRRPPPSEPGVHSGLTMECLGDQAVRKELKLSDDQIKKVDELRAKGQAPLTTSGEPLKDFLQPGQIERLRQIQMQARQTLGGPAYLLRYHEVVTAVKPTDDQEEKIRPLLDEATQTYVRRLLNLDKDDPKKLGESIRNATEKLAQVLTPGQLAKLKDLLGSPFPGVDQAARTSAHIVVRTPDLTREQRYLQEETVRAELKLSEKQVEQLADVEAKRREFLKDYASLSRQDRSRKDEEVRKSVEQAVTAVLSAEQARRLEQIILQQRVRLSLAWELTSPNVEAQLGLDREQREKIRGIRDYASRIRSLILDELFRPGTDLLQEYSETRAAFDKQTNEKVLAVLTEAQRLKWQEILGKPFEGKLGLPLLHR